MKAYIASTKYENYVTIVFAETAGHFPQMVAMMKEMRNNDETD